jgi:hypothetical protein
MPSIMWRVPVPAVPAMIVEIGSACRASIEKRVLPVKVQLQEALEHLDLGDAVEQHQAVLAIEQREIAARFAASRIRPLLGLRCAMSKPVVEQ